MARQGFQFSKQDIQNLILSGLVVGAAFAGFKEATSFSSIATVLFFGLITVSARELGQRTIGQWMEAEVNLELSRNGAFTALFVAIFSYISSLDLVFLTPLFSEFNIDSHEHWGKGIDAIWSKREYWLVSSGITTLLIGWVISYSLGVSTLAEMISLFTFFQLLPLDSNKQVCGKLDGVYIILWSGFMWLIFMGITIIAMILSVL